MQEKPAPIKSRGSPSQQSWPALARLIQVNLGLDDLSVIDAPALISQVKALGANGIVFNTGGIYAWYPSQVPGHTLHPTLDGRDMVAEAAKAAREAGLAFVGRYDFSLIEQPLADQNPSWVARTDDGAPLEIGGPRSDGMPPLIATTMTGAYRRKVALEILAEAHRRTPLDAVFFNAPEPFLDASEGSPQPTDTDSASAAFFETWNAWGATIAQVDPDCLILGRFNAFQYRDLDQLTDTSDLLTSQPLDWLDGGLETQRPSWFAALTTKVGRRAMGDKPPVIIVHAAPGLSWRHVGLPSVEARMWLSQVLANGGGLWHTLTSLPDQQQDTRLLDDIRWANQRAQAAEPWLKDTKAIASIGIVIARRKHSGSDHSEAAGLVDVLTSARRFYHPLSEADLTDEGLLGLNTLVLPSVECLSQDEEAAIIRFAEAGGAVIATFRTGWRDETGAARSTPALANLMGIASAGERVDDLYASYLSLTDETPLSRRLSGATLVAGQGPFQEVAPRSDAAVWAKLATPFAARGGVGKPPERVRKPEISRFPAVISTTKAVYFAHAIGSLVTRYGLPDHRNLVLAALDHVAKPQKVQIEAPTGVHASLFEQGDRLVLHLVNAVGQRPLADCVPVRNTIISADAEVMRTVPDGNELKRRADGSFVLNELGVWKTIEIRPAKG
jgi:hypothetical protein